MQIRFDTPDYIELKKQGFQCVDMHFHSTYSDGAASISQILDKARTLGIGFAITDHNEIKGVIEAYGLKRDEDFILPGIEVKSDEGVDILFYFSDIRRLEKFYQDEIFPKKVKYFHSTKTTIPLKKIFELSENYDCLSSVAHPFGYTLRSTKKDVFSTYKETFALFPVFEAINGGNGRKHNLESIDFLKEHSKGFTGGTDGHSIYPLGNIVTCAKAKNPKGFLDAIRKKENLVFGKETALGKVGEYGRFGINKIANIFKK